MQIRVPSSFGKSEEIEQTELPSSGRNVNQAVFAGFFEVLGNAWVSIGSFQAPTGKAPAGNQTAARAFEGMGNRRRIDGGNMPSHTLRTAGGPELQAYRTRERSREVRPIDNEDYAAEIAAKLRSQIPCSTDPAWLEKMAREVEK